jgi:hypothetical protein
LGLGRSGSTRSPPTIFRGRSGDWMSGIWCNAAGKGTGRTGGRRAGGRTPEPAAPAAVAWPSRGGARGGPGGAERAGWGGVGSGAGPLAGVDRERGGTQGQRRRHREWGGGAGGRSHREPAVQAARDERDAEWGRGHGGRTDQHPQCHLRYIPGVFGASSPGRSLDGLPGRLIQYNTEREPSDTDI